MTAEDQQLITELAELRPDQSDALADALRASVRDDLFGASGEPFRLGRFTVIRPLGGGGMGTVFVAYDPDLDRKIALKVLHNRGARGRHDVLREGRALARLKHPAVVTVYEVGVVDDQVFVAMEYVSGSDLRRWLDAPRTAEAVLALLVDAGRGLAAAHEAGLVHLDFKPENVLVDTSGRARVIDFGLARTTEEPGPAADNPAGDGSPARVGGGTPGYIAPERLAGGRGDVRADQYSFCVTCWEALAPVRARVAERVLAALRRGMSPDPQARFASMPELLAALTDRPARRRLRGLAALAVVCVVAGAYAAGQRSQVVAPRCPSPWTAVEAIWNDERAATVRVAFAATEVPFADETWATVKPALDRYSAAWRTLHATACTEAARGLIPEAYLEQRLGCLEDRRLHLAALVDRYAGADAATVTAAVTALEHLPPIDACADVARADAMFAGDRAGVEQRLAVRGAIARARADLDTGRTADASAAIDSALARAREVDSPALVAEALIVAGGADRLAGKLESGVARAREALTTAVTHVEPVQAAWAALLLVQLRHAQSAGSAGNDDLLALAAAFARQAGEPPQLQVGVLLTRATETIEAGRFTAARDDLRRVRELALEHDNRRAAALALANIGKCDDYLGENAASVAANRQALAELEPLLGALHPTIAGLRQNLGSILIATGDHDAALQELARVKAIVAENYPGDHPVAAAAHLNAGIAHMHRGRLADALAEYRVALAMNERLLGPDGTVVAHVLCNMAETLRALGRVDEALAASGRAVTLQSGALPADHCDRMVCNAIHGGILTAAGRPDEALRLLGPTLERSAAGDCSPKDIGELELELARALGASGGPRARALALLDAAERHLAEPKPRAELEHLRASIR